MNHDREVVLVLNYLKGCDIIKIRNCICDKDDKKKKRLTDECFYVKNRVLNIILATIVIRINDDYNIIMNKSFYV